MSPSAAIPGRIEKKVLLKSPIERVWRAIGDSTRFGAWFGLAVEGPWVAGKSVRARIVPTRVDAEVAAMQKPYDGVAFEMAIERVEPPRLFSYRWHPYGVEPGVDVSAEPMTLVEFVLEEAPGGTLLTITESGFEEIPLARREKAFHANEGGWEKQTQLVAKYLALQP